jgi:hypothetical protein
MFLHNVNLFSPIFTFFMRKVNGIIRKLFASTVIVHICGIMQLSEIFNILLSIGNKFY